MGAGFQPGCCGCSGGGTIACSPCAIPGQNLTLSWVNPITGNGSVTLVYASGGGSSAWDFECSSGLIYQLACNAGSIELRVFYFISGACPTGQSAYCSNLRSDPFALTLSSHTCSPFSLTFSTTISGCPVLVNNGYESFTVTL
jgi:hypothetical protein